MEVKWRNSRAEGNNTDVLERKDSMAKCYQQAWERACVTSPLFGQGTTSFFFLMVIGNSLLLLKSLPINIINSIKFLQLWVNTFPRFVAIGFYFLSETLISIASPIIFLFIHNHLTLRKWRYTPLHVPTQSWRGKSAVIRIYWPLTFNGYSNSIKTVKRQRNLGLTLPKRDLNLQR
jgi:hypothetical protein